MSPTGKVICRIASGDYSGWEEWGRSLVPRKEREGVDDFLPMGEERRLGVKEIWQKLEKVRSVQKDEKRREGPTLR